MTFDYLIIMLKDIAPQLNKDFSEQPFDRPESEGIDSPLDQSIVSSNNVKTNTANSGVMTRMQWINFV